MITKILLVGLVVCVFAGVCYIAIHMEKKAFNNGDCPECGRRMKLFDCDSQGGRGYKCPNCKYTTWVSYNVVDKKFKEVNS